MFFDLVGSHFQRFVHNLHNRDVCFYLGTLGVALLAEALAMGYRNSSLHRLLSLSPSARNDLACDAIFLFGFGRLLGTAGSLGIPLLLCLEYRRHVGITLLAHVHNPVFAYAVWFVLMDFAYYWYHRCAHEIACLWQAHKYHHSAVEFNIITGNRIHVLDNALGETFKVIPLTLLGMPPDMYVAVRLTVRFLDILQHSAIAWDFGWIGKWVCFGPIGHRIHHSAEREHWDRNYGNYLVIWDRLFGTWYAGGRVNEDVGVSDNHFNTGSVARDWWLAAKFFYRDLRRGMRTGVWRTELARISGRRRRTGLGSGI